jgi:predicted nucleic acid-binding protein
MEKLLIDTNIIVDLLAKREDFYQEAQELFTLAEERKLALFISSLTFVNTHYILSKYFDAKYTHTILVKFKTLVEVLALDNHIIERALASNFNDFADAVQYHTALANMLDIIITRNKKDFKRSDLPVLTAREFLSRKG